ncbi:MAG: hypothetical protein ACRDTJ_23055, partial [Pseudonocardiaceae bacterium]
SIGFDRFDFVELSGDIHGGFSPIAGQPVVGQPATAEAAVLGPIASARFSLIDRQGNEISTLPLERGSRVGDPEHFLGETTLPGVPFKVAVTGVDDNGSAYRREYPALYRTQQVGVEVTGSRLVEIAPGDSRTLEFKVKNNGPDATFDVAVDDERGFVTSPARTSHVIPSGGVAVIPVSVLVPATSTEGDVSSVVLTATQQGAPDRYNSASVGVLVTETNQAPVCYEPSTQIALWPPNGNMQAVPLAGNAAVIDPEGDEVALVVESITQDEPVGTWGARTPDGSGIGTNVAQVRAERLGGGNGRVYQVNYKATDGGGMSCTGFLRVGVPHDKADSTAVDDGQQHDSLGQ